MSEVLACFKNIDPMAAILACAVAVAVWLAWSTTRNRERRFNFEDLLLDRNGKTSLYKLGQFISLVLSSWGFIYLTLAYKLTEFYFGLYMGAWASASLASKWLDRADRNEGPK